MNPRTALVALGLVLVAFFAPILARGRVVFPHDNALQVGLASDGGEGSNLRFSDQSAYFVPEMEAHLHAPRSEWIATWTDCVQLGRPLTHLSGLSPAYLPNWVLSRVVDDPFVLHTWLFALTVLGTALFAFLFFRALEVDAWIAAAGACAAATSAPVLYWSGFLVYASGFCWTFCVLWLAVRTIERPTLARATGIAAATSLLLVSAYPQHVLWFGAFVAAWTLVRIARSSFTTKERITRVAVLAGAALAGVAASSLVLLDVLVAYQRSARTDVDVGFFLAALPSTASARDVVRELALLVDPFVLGNPAEPAYTRLATGFAFGALATVGCVVALRAWREHAVALAFVVVGVAMTLVPTLYAFGVEHLGLSLSRTVPSLGAVVPALVCGVSALDGLVRAGRGRGLAIAGLVGAIALVAIARWSSAAEVAAGGASAWLLAVALLAAASFALVVARRPMFVALAAFLPPFVEGGALVLSRPRDAIHTSSPLVDGLHERCASGGRYALVGEAPKFVLPANEELLLGLSSVHSYDSLSSTAYQEWVTRFSREGTKVRGRRFNRVTDDALLASGELEKAGVTHVLSARPLRVPGWKAEGVLGPFAVYATGADTSRALLFDAPRFGGGAEVGERRSAGDGAVDATTRGPWTAGGGVVRVEEARSMGGRDELSFASSVNERLLVLRRQFHPQWRAWARRDEGGGTTPGVDSPGAELRCVRVDGFHQGVIVPPGVDEVVLEFHPWVRWAWIPWAVFAGLFAFAASTARRRTA